MASRIGRDRVEVTVRDSGTGISSEYHARIFDPFFTTKEVGRGTGLGLSINYGITHEYGGEITVESQPQQGATCFVTLPIATGVFIASQMSHAIH